MGKKREVLIKKHIYNHLKSGMFKKDAALMAGISEKTFYRWVKEDDSFDSHVEANILEYKRSLIQTLNINAKNNGTLALKILAIRYPKEWGENSGQYQEELDSKSKVAELVARMDELIARANIERLQNSITA